MISPSFFEEFPALIETELRYVEFSDIPTATDLTSEIPNGRYEFFEYFCTDANCDCQQATINVTSYELNKSWAIIQYGWGSGKGIARFTLHPHSINDSISNEFLEFFKEMIYRDRRYAARIQKHYLQFKERMREREALNATKNYIYNILGKKNRRNDLCHCNSGKKFKKCCLQAEQMEEVI